MNRTLKTLRNGWERVDMGKVIAVVNQKGGVGKTTTTVNLAASLSLADQKVLLIDFDPQGNASSGVGVSPNMDENLHTIYHALMGELKLSEVIVQTGIDHLDLAPANPHLAGAEIELVGSFAREGKLKAALAEVKHRYDYIFIDCPPTLGLLTVNALTAADSVLVPLQAEYFALEGLGQLMNTIGLIRQSVNQSLEIEGIVLTMFNSQVKLSHEIEKEVRTHFAEQVFKTVIPRNIKLSECSSFGKPIVLYDVNSKGCIAYLDLAREMMTKTQNAKVGSSESVTMNGSLRSASEASVVEKISETNDVENAGLKTDSAIQENTFKPSRPLPDVGA
jgi:chromosome partitioning protein